MAATSPIYQRDQSRFSPSHSAIEVSFILHTIKGAQFSNQSACVAVNGHSFILHPREVKSHLRFYESGFMIYIPSDEIVRFAVGVITCDDKNAGFLHTFARHSFKPPTKPIVQDIIMETVGGSYIITASIYVAPSMKCSTPSPSKKPQVIKKRPQTQIVKSRKTKTLPPKQTFRPQTRFSLNRTGQTTPFVTAPKEDKIVE
ncbi:hypothetical protein TRFO_24313 [Tritrichomonas foetus]|uniref:Uncharacterized protein n=1 Tax=Tritrichomonas foetus TaxID=1144522 RepID=A0A1J4K964_9EUKA|nr:hypothetical protein TRFO_24313 [Tritrichomonas foetus]|eukprot:OHT07482.1 hypothetical protein TRFO_24313 [Tritrichomonas foetus]